MSDYFREVYGRQEEQPQQCSDSLAFPMLYEGTTRTGSPGMALRDYFAAKALQGLLASPTDPNSFESLAEFCYKAADAMIKVRNEK